jgi:hypothetical protein
MSPAQRTAVQLRPHQQTEKPSGGELGGLDASGGCSAAQQNDAEDKTCQCAAGTGNRSPKPDDCVAVKSLRIDDPVTANEPFMTAPMKQ